jgi:hypothetical protein
MTLQQIETALAAGRLFAKMQQWPHVASAPQRRDQDVENAPRRVPNSCQGWLPCVRLRAAR